MQKYYKIFSNCIPVEAAGTGALYDLQREKLYHLPKKLLSSLKKNNEKEIERLYESFSEDEHKDVDNLIESLKKEDLIYVSEKPISSARFPDIDFTFNEPAILSNIIISIFNDSDVASFLKKIKEVINQTGCRNIQIRIEKGITKSGFLKIIEAFNKTIIKFISLVINAEDAANMDIEKLIVQYPRILNIIFYNYKSEIDFITRKEFEHIEFVKFSDDDFPAFEKLNDLRFMYFKPNIIKYTEARTYNLYYNKKAYITSNGNIYNSPYSKNSYGNIFKEDLLKIIASSSFTKLWKINKDKIKVCRDCEYRYTCSDGRIPLKDEKDEYYFTEECKYNPYTNTFNDK